MKIHSFNVQPNLPENIKFLEELANNMWFTWNWPGRHEALRHRLFGFP